MNIEVHLFVLWPLARPMEDRILTDMSAHCEILAKIESSWPEGMTGEEGYRAFYGPGLPDAVGKAKRAGVGKFLIVVVRLKDPVYDWRMTHRGPEFLNVDMFDMKWRYRSWSKGLHRVHGTASQDEARRDILLLTGQPLARWVEGTADPKSVVTLSKEALATAGEAPTAQPPASLEAARTYLDCPNDDVYWVAWPGIEVDQSFNLQKKLWEVDGTATPEPIRWHTGTKGTYVAQRITGARPLSAWLAEGNLPPSLSDGAAKSVRRLVAALDAAGIVHRNITPETLRLTAGGAVELVDFVNAVARSKYRTEPRHFRKALATRLVPLGGTGVPYPGAWNDRLALAQCLKRLPPTAALTAAIAELEKEARAGKGTLRVALKKLRFRLVRLYLFPKGTAAERAHARAFVKGAFGFGRRGA